VDLERNVLSLQEVNIFLFKGHIHKMEETVGSDSAWVVGVVLRRGLKAVVSVGGVEDVIVIESLKKVYGQFAAVNDVSLRIHRGEIFGILGPNGAGKTTLLETVLGMRYPTSGSVHICGIDPCADRRSLTALVSVQPQSAGLFGHLTVLETLQMFSSFHVSPLPMEQVLQDIGLQEKARTQTSRLSGGQRQRLLIGVALIANTEIIVLDEPTGSLDPKARRRLWDTIRARRDAGKTVVLTTHSMEEAQALCDRVAIVNKGRVLAMDTPHQLILTHVPEQVILYETSVTVPVNELQKIPGVVKVQITHVDAKQVVRIQTMQPDETLRTLLFRNLLPSAHGFRLENGTLEDVFLILTGDQGGKTV
jgi:ABC-2 type transport system ATP-binding protein